MKYLEIILDEGKDNLDICIDYDEVKMLKNTLRGMGVTEESKAQGVRRQINNAE